MRTFFALLIPILAALSGMRLAYANSSSLPFKTLTLAEFNARYTDNGLLYRGGRTTKALERIRSGRFQFDRDSGSELHSGANYREINDQHGPYRNPVNSILPFTIIAPPNKPFIAVANSELAKMGSQEQTLLEARLGKERAATLKTAKDKLLALGIDVLVQDSGTVYGSHIVIFNDAVIRVPTIAQFMKDAEDRYRARLAKNIELDFVLDSLFRAYLYQYSLLTDHEKVGILSPQELAPAKVDEIASTLEWYQQYRKPCVRLINGGDVFEEDL